MLIAHLSDIHLCRENGGRKQRRLIIDLIRLAKARGAEHFLISGDIVEYANHKELETFYSEILRAGISAQQLSVIPGNHDIFPVSEKKLWRSIFRFGKHPRYFERFNSISRDFYGEVIHEKPLIYFRVLNDELVLFAMDTNDYSVRTHRTAARGIIARQNWQVIDDAIHRYGFNEKKKILMLHHYPFKWGQAGLNGSDEPGGQSSSGLSGGEPMNVDYVNLDQVKDEIGSRDWHFVVCGHSHRNRGVRKIGNIPIINSASRPSKDHYICSLIEADAKVIVPQRLETNLDKRLRMIFSWHQKKNKK